MIIKRYWTRLSMNHGDQRKDVLAEVNNTLQDLHNFSHQVKAKSNNIVSFFIKKNPCLKTSKNIMLKCTLINVKSHLHMPVLRQVQDVKGCLVQQIHLYSSNIADVICQVLFCCSLQYLLCF